MKTKILQKQFKRKETKYIVEKATLALLLEELSAYMEADEYATSTITNIYFDNDQFDMIQDSLAKKNGREKIRMRVYDAHPTATSQAFLEIKKKENKVGFKYRLTSNPVSVTNYIEKGMADVTITDEKVTSELEILRQRYGAIKPKMYIYYDRVSFKGLVDRQIRLTIDHHLLYRAVDVAANKGKFGHHLLDPSKVIMEIKVPDQVPDWLQNLLDKYRIEKQSFSKYGNAYKLASELGKEEVVKYAVIQ